METKLWVAFCALLLLLNLASADHESGVPENKNQTNPLPSHPVPTETHTSHTTLSPTSTNHTNHTSSVNIEITESPSTNHSSNTSHDSAPPLLSSTTLSNQPEIKINTSTPTAEPAATTTTATTTTTVTTTTLPTTTSTATTTTTTTLPTTTSTQPSSTSSSSHQFSTSPPPAATSEFDGHPRTSSKTPTKDTITPSSSTSTQAKPHVDNPSQLNVGGDTKMVHESPTLDPLLAGLVSAFIITAVIITLLLFLKLRRRDNRPEFRRLQDLPMDDIMEDTPLSMYSY